MRRLTLCAVLAALAFAPATSSRPETYISCKVVVEATQDGLHVRARGTLTAWDNHDPGFEKAELDGSYDVWGSGKTLIETTHPPLSIEVLGCPPQPRRLTRSG